MADIALVAPDVTTAPEGYSVPGAQEIILKSLRASYDGSGAAGSFIPTIRITTNTGTVVGEYTSQTLTAGASADVTWFPRGGVSSSNAPSKASVLLEGQIYNDGTVLAGTGFTVAYNGTNGYTVTFATPVPVVGTNPPTVVVSANNNNPDGAYDGYGAFCYGCNTDGLGANWISFYVETGRFDGSPAEGGGWNFVMLATS